MAGNIKGITIEFAGDTTRLDKALRQINKETRDIDKELKQVTNALKFNPTSVDLWRQKQQLLTQKLNETKTKLDALKQAQAQMDAKGVDKNSEEYRKLQREIIETESKLKTFEGQLRQIGNVKLKALSESFKDVGNKLTAAGQSMREVSLAAAALAGSIGAVTKKSAEWADDLNTMSKRYRIGTDDLQMYSAAADLVDVSVEDIAKSHVKLNKSMLAAQQGSKTQTAAFDALGVSVTNADGSLRDSDEVWQDTIAALGEMTNETERDALAQQILGKSAANLNPLIEDGGEAYKNLAETMEKYGLDFIDQETLDKANEFNDELDTIKAIGLVAFQSIGTELAGYLAPALQTVVDYVGQFANWLTNLDPEVLATIAAIAGVVAVLAPVLIIIGKVATGVSAIISVVNFIIPILSTIIGVLGGVAGALWAVMAPILPIIAVIAALIAIGVLLYKNWDKIKAKASEMWEHVKTVFETLKNDLTIIWNAIKTAVTTAWNAIKNAIVTPIKNTVNNAKTAFNMMKNTLTNVWNSIKSATSTAWNAVKTAITTPIKNAWNTIKGIIDKIKSKFPLKMGKIFSDLKLPHISVSGGKAPFGIGGKGSLPKFHVDWYAKGGIFNSPNVIGIGEAGPEAVVPLDTLWNKLDRIADASSGGEGGNIIININGANDPRAVAEEVKRVLIQETNRRRLAWQ